MSFDPTWLFLSLIPSGIGFVLFVYGKKQERMPHMLAGIVFTIYPYFTSSIVDGSQSASPGNAATSITATHIRKNSGSA